MSRRDVLTSCSVLVLADCVLIEDNFTMKCKKHKVSCTGNVPLSGEPSTGVPTCLSPAGRQLKACPSSLPRTRHSKPLWGTDGTTGDEVSPHLMRLVIVHPTAYVEVCLLKNSGIKLPGVLTSTVGMWRVRTRRVKQNNNLLFDS